MYLASPKGNSDTVAYPRTLSSIAASVCGLAIFLILASLFLVSQPIGFTVRGYFYDIDLSSKPDSLSSGNKTILDSRNDDSEDLRDLDSIISELNETANHPQHDGNIVDNSYAKSDLSLSGYSQTETVAHHDGGEGVIDKNGTSRSQDANDLSNFQQRDEATSYYSPLVVSETKESEDRQREEAIESSTSNVTKGVENAITPSPGSLNGSNIIQPGLDISSLSPAADISQSNLVDSGCDLYHGKWVYDSSGPLYTNNTCPVLTQTQNCQGNGRPDKEYENWRWKPAKCDLPRFDAKKFLELMRGKTLAFIGDSVARNQMESLLCILWQASIKAFYSDITAL
ncbi:Protein yls7 [Sarracenia purpurea var. burkii]